MASLLRECRVAVVRQTSQFSGVVPVFLLDQRTLPKVSSFNFAMRQHPVNSADIRRHQEWSLCPHCEFATCVAKVSYRKFALRFMERIRADCRHLMLLLGILIS